jgi:hypothetical protein
MINESLKAQPTISEVEFGVGAWFFGPMPQNKDLSRLPGWSFGIGQVSYEIPIPGQQQLVKQTFGIAEPQFYNIKSRGYVSFTNLTSTGKTIIDFGMLTHPDDLANIVPAVMEMHRVTNTPEFRRVFPVRVNPPDYIEGNPESGFDLRDPRQVAFYIKGFLESAQHIGGTTKMGRPNDRTRVVDSNFKVVGTKNLRICDTGVFPKPIAANGGGPAMALSQMLANKIVEEYRVRRDRWHRRGRGAFESNTNNDDDDDDDDEYVENDESNFQRKLDLDSIETVEIPENYCNDPLED